MDFQEKQDSAEHRGFSSLKQRGVPCTAQCPLSLRDGFWKFCLRGEYLDFKHTSIFWSFERVENELKWILPSMDFQEKQDSAKHRGLSSLKQRGVPCTAQCPLSLRGVFWKFCIRGEYLDFKHTSIFWAFERVENELKWILPSRRNKIPPSTEDLAL